jgi:hypothetical protein
LFRRKEGALLRSFTTSLALAVAASGAACGGSPTAPSATAATGAITTLGCGEELDGYQCRAEYATSAATPPRDVTGLADWSTSDTSVATVNSVGFVTVLRAGSVAIRVSYRGADGFITLQVQPGGLRRYYRALSGFVTDSRDGMKISDVTVRIVDGPNADRTTTTGSDGAYQLYDLEPGTFTVRFSKPGYVTTDRSFTLTGDKFNDLSITLARGSS